jgi:hypothetical protein
VSLCELFILAFLSDIINYSKDGRLHKFDKSFWCGCRLSQIDNDRVILPSPIISDSEIMGEES